MSERFKADARLFGHAPDGQAVYLYEIRNRKGMKASITNYGGIIQSLWVRNREGQWVDVVQGFDKAESYHDNKKFIGATIGRYANAISRGEFSLNGRTYVLDRNYFTHCVHGGSRGFYNVVWQARQMAEDCLHLSYFSPDGEEGFPGNLLVGVTYRVTEDDALEICYQATSDQDTVISLTNHSYFNLYDQNGEHFAEHRLFIDADYFTEVDAEVVTTGVVAKVDEVFDFRTERLLVERIDAEHPQIKAGGGYDHNYLLNGSGYRKVAALFNPVSGIHMDVHTTLPGMQLYSDNDRSSVIGKKGAIYDGRKAVCLETQEIPDAPNKVHFLPAVLRACESYSSKTKYTFSVR